MWEIYDKNGSPTLKGYWSVQLNTLLADLVYRSVDNSYEKPLSIRIQSLSSSEIKVVVPAGIYYVRKVQS